MKQETKDNTNKESEAKPKKTGFFQSLLESLFNSSNPEVEKKRRLKAIAKTFNKNKYHAFYKTQTFEVQPAFAKLFYDIYKLTSPAQLLFRANPNPAMFKAQIINYNLSERQLELLEHFDEQKIHEISRQVSIDKIAETLETELNEFSAEFTAERTAKTENIYHAYTIFRDFCSYDYYVLLKKFSSKIQENQFGTVPVFEKINAEYVVDDLKDFVAVAYLITDESIQWNALFEFLKNSRNAEVMNVGSWKKLIAKVKSIQASDTFELMLRHISQNPDYHTENNSTYETIVGDYVDKIEDDTRQILDKLNAEQKESKANSLCEQIFGTTEIDSLKNYNTSLNSVLEKKDLNIFTYAEPLNYLKSFLLEYVKTDIRQFFDVVVVRGQWDTGLAQPISNAYQELLKTSDEITVFDNDMNEEGPLGSKIKTLLPKTAHDPGAENIINRVVSDANERAKDYLLSSTQNLVIIGKTLKQLIEDYLKPKPVLVQNWKELERFLEHPMKEFSVNIYKKIYLFVQLMQQYLKE